KDAQLRLLRWSGFVKTDEEVWNQNTKKFQDATGAAVNVEYIGFEDVRPKAAMAANLNTGPDLVMGWYDDPHIYPRRLVDVPDDATEVVSVTVPGAGTRLEANRRRGVLA